MNQQSIDKLENFFSNYTLLTIAKNKIIIEPGEEISNIYYLKKGLVRQYSLSTEGSEMIVHIFRPMSYFPMMLLLGSKENGYYFQAIEDCLVYKAPGEEVISFIKKDSEILFDLTKRFASGIAGLLSRLENLTFRNMESRIASILLYFGSHFGENEKGKIRINIPLTHKEMAEWIGVSRETISRKMKQMQKNDLIDYGGKSITILDWKRLEDLVASTISA